MSWAQIYQTATDKPLDDFVAALGEAGHRRGFVVHNDGRTELAHTFATHGVTVANGFDLQLIQLCKPDKAAASLQYNPERAALMPKFIATFTRDGRTEVRMLRYHRAMIEALIDDRIFGASLQESYDTLVAMIEEACAAGTAGEAPACGVI
jgi:uncharacterized protein (DUF302 family)